MNNFLSVLAVFLLSKLEPVILGPLGTFRKKKEHGIENIDLNIAEISWEKEFVPFLFSLFSVLYC